MRILLSEPKRPPALRAEYTRDICGYAQSMCRIYADMRNVCAEYMRICAGYVEDICGYAQGLGRIHAEYMKNIYGIHDRDRRR